MRGGLYYAMASRHNFARTRILELLVEAASDVNHVDGSGRTPLRYAVEAGSNWAAGLFMMNGAQLPVEDRGRASR
eukprot:16449792-Heterocapsa_arctica.AAC.1